MKKITSLLFFLIPFLGFSQTPIEKIQNHITDNRTKFSLTQADVSDLVITNDFVTADNTVFIYHVKQRINGIEVSNSDSNFLIQNNKVIGQGGKNFIQSLSQKINTATPSINVTDGVSLALSQLKEAPLNSIQILEVASKANSNKYKLSNGVLTDSPINAQLVYYLTDTTTLRLAWNYEFYTQNRQHIWNVMIDAVDGKILDKQDLVISCNFGGRDSHKGSVIDASEKFTQNFLKYSNQKSVAFNPGTTQYRVIPFNYESPNHSARQLVSNPEYTTNASPNGWHNASTAIGGATTTYAITRGNNVFAMDDINGNDDDAGLSPNGGTYPNLTFDFAYPGNNVAANTYLSASTTNLFYMSNIMHDLWYQYGFNEANKNFQTANYGRGGVGGDAVIAQSQDRGVTAPTAQTYDNSNFGTPSDGGAGRMQMFLWDLAPGLTFTVNSPASVAGGYAILDNSFSPGHVAPPAAPGITQNLVLFNDGTPDNSDACTAATNAAALNGKIAVIRRGACSFAIKAKAAQNAGAVAVIIVNNAAGAVPGMSGADATITIPVVAMGQIDGEALITAMGLGTVNANLQGPAAGFVNIDGDFDNSIIAHEYGHGISTRLSGNCLGGNEQMGEGWSDWFWFMMQIKPGDTRNNAKGMATFAFGQSPAGGGIRAYKYSTDMAVNPQTYASTNTAAVPHGVGSVWATILWDLTWDYIDKYGYDPNIYTGTGGNNKIMKLVLDAIKIDGCNPTFITGRDAIIAADQATTGGKDFCMIWKAFARRGVGVNASSGTSSITDQAEDFTEPAPGPNCTLGVNYFENEDMIKIYPNPSNGEINIKINQFSGKVNLQVIDLNGRVVYSLNNTDFNVEKTINLTHLQSGMYIVKIDGSELNYTKKIILN